MEFLVSNNIEIKEGVVFRSNKDGSIVVMKMNDDDNFFKINGVAAEMWQSFSQQKCNLGEIAKNLSAEYSVSPEKIISDSQAFLSKALELDLIKLS